MELTEKENHADGSIKLSRFLQFYYCFWWRTTNVLRLMRNFPAVVANSGANKRLKYRQSSGISSYFLLGMFFSLYILRSHLHQYVYMQLLLGQKSHSREGAFCDWSKIMYFAIWIRKFPSSMYGIRCSSSPLCGALIDLASLQWQTVIGRNFVKIFQSKTRISKVIVLKNRYSHTGNDRLLKIKRIRTECWIVTSITR